MQVFSVEPQPLARRFVQSCVQHNRLTDRVHLLDRSLEQLQSSDLLGHQVR